MSQESSSAQRMHWATAEVLVAAAGLADAGELPEPLELRARLLGALQHMVTRCRAAGISDEDAAEARYALVAFIDEQILKSNWSGRSEWMNNPLQLELYQEYVAGENFFKRLRALLRRPVLSPALVVFYHCLAFGFVGARSPTKGIENPRSSLEAIRRRLRPLFEGPLNPHALPVRPPPRLPRGRPLVAVLGAANIAILVVALGLMSLVLRRAVGSAEADLLAEPQATGSAGATGK